LRLYRYDALSLWVDEGLTVGFGRLPWDTVLGLHGAYETHPPLYFVFVKVAELFAPELTAGRLVSVLAGTLTLPLVYALAWRLIGRWGALIATGVLAVSPLHIWYSQEARPYALCFLIITVGYLSLAGFHQSLDRRWAVLYGASITLALYTDYSSIYALAPQALLLIYLLFVHGKRALRLWIAGVIGVGAFLPWLPLFQVSIAEGVL
jgi:mannosyltransferase